MLRARVYEQAQAQVNSDLRAAQEIYASTLDRLKDALRIHATRMVIYGALQRGDVSGLDGELDRIRRAEHLDVLTLTDGNGTVLIRASSPDAGAGDHATRGVVRRVLKDSDAARLDGGRDR